MGRNALVSQIIGAPDRDIGLKTGTFGVFGGIDIAQISKAGRCHFAGKFLEIKRAELVPFGEDHAPCAPDTASKALSHHSTPGSSAAADGAPRGNTVRPWMQ